MKKKIVALLLIVFSLTVPSYAADVSLNHGKVIYPGYVTFAGDENEGTLTIPFYEDENPNQRDIPIADCQLHWTVLSGRTVQFDVIFQTAYSPISSAYCTIVYDTDSDDSYYLYSTPQGMGGTRLNLTDRYTYVYAGTYRPYLTDIQLTTLDGTVYRSYGFFPGHTLGYYQGNLVIK